MMYTSNDVTIIICAYKTCDYLSACIESILAQSVKCDVVISTSTPNDFIKEHSEKYGIPVMVNPDGGHAKDYNFALKECKTKLCIMAHQDDLLHPDFVKDSLEALSKAKDPIFSFTDYREIHDDVISDKPSTLIKVKKIMLIPFKIPGLCHTKFGKRLIQRLGDPISHPTVTYVVDKMPEESFRANYRSAMDWDLWERLSKVEGSFVYVNKVLHYHRMHEAQAMSALVNDSSLENVRNTEEYDIFCRFWPKWIARLIMKLYKKSQGAY